MGREIRMVPPNWEHPKGDNSGYQSLYDEDYPSAVKEWKEGYALWEAGTHPDQEDYEYWDWMGMPPDEVMYRPAFIEDATWFQIYETVSEGTPVSPPFKTKPELVDYLVEHGDFWDQDRGDGGWERKNAESFVGTGFAMSAMARVKDGKAEIKMARDGTFDD